MEALTGKFMFTVKGKKFRIPYVIGENGSVNLDWTGYEDETEAIEIGHSKFYAKYAGQILEREMANQVTIYDVNSTDEKVTELEKDVNIENTSEKENTSIIENVPLTEKVELSEIESKMKLILEQNEALMKKVQELESKPKGGRKKIGVTRKLSLTLPEEDWDFLDRDSVDHKQFADYLRSIVQAWISMRGRRK